MISWSSRIAPCTRCWTARWSMLRPPRTNLASNLATWENRKMSNLCDALHWIAQINGRCLAKPTKALLATAFCNVNVWKVPISNMAGRAQKSKGVIFLFSWFHSNQLLAFKCFMERKYQGWAQIWGLFEGMNVSHWVISQGEWSTVGQCEEAKRGFVILYGLWDTAKCLSRDTLGHFCSTNKWDTHTHTATHTYINAQTHTTLEIPLLPV